MDRLGSLKAEVFYKNGIFYGWNGNRYIELAAVSDETILDNLAAGNQVITANVGVANTGVTAVEYGNAHQHVTVLTVSQAAALTLADGAAIADGYLLYTFPAGALWVNSAYMNMTITNAEHDTEATDVGLGTTIATGEVAVLGGTAGFENIMTGQTGAVGTALVAQEMYQTSPFRLPIGAGNPHLVHFNAACDCADTAGLALNAAIAGTVVLEWTFLN